MSYTKTASRFIKPKSVYLNPVKKPYNNVFHKDSNLQARKCDTYRKRVVGKFCKFCDRLFKFISLQHMGNLVTNQRDYEACLRVT